MTESTAAPGSRLPCPTSPQRQAPGPPAETLQCPVKAAGCSRNSGGPQHTWPGPPGSAPRGHRVSTQPATSGGLVPCRWQGPGHANRLPRWLGTAQETQPEPRPPHGWGSRGPRGSRSLGRRGAALVEDSGLRGSAALGPLPNSVLPAGSRGGGQRGPPLRAVHRGQGCRRPGTRPRWPGARGHTEAEPRPLGQFLY